MAAVERALDQSAKLAEYVNGALGSVGRRYGCVIPWIDAERWTTPLATRPAPAAAAAAAAARGTV